MWLVPIIFLAFQQTHTETWPDGSKRCEYEFVLDVQGEEVRQGAYHSWFEGGEPESEGRFEQGKESGAWVFFHRNGRRAEAGQYADGLRSGPWETFFPDGSAESKGPYVRGTRSGRWTFWSADGKKDLEASGLYKFEVYRSKGEDGRHYRGYVVDNKRQGAWASYWPEQEGRERRVQLEGAFVAGQRVGPWTFHHPDGVASTLLLSGEYAAGAWVARSELSEPPPFDPAAYPALEPSPRGWPEDREALGASLRTALGTRTLTPELEARLETAGPRALPLALELLRALDPERAEERATMGFLEDQVLRRLCAGHVLSTSGLNGPSQAPAARELVRAWLSLWLVTRADLDFWEAEVPGPARPGAAFRDVLQDPPLLEQDARYDVDARAAIEARRSSAAATKESPPAVRPESASNAPRASVYRLRFGKEKENQLHYAAAGTRECVTRALVWLAAHQNADGHWDNANFGAECARRGQEPCEGPGNVNYDVGATGLALLAFLGDGNGPSEGPYAELVARGLAWLVKQQSGEGLIGSRGPHDFLYGHAIATTALCEGLGMGAGELRASAEQALAFLQLGRLPDFVWRYDVPATERGDTSMTGWAVHALLAAREVGFTIDEQALSDTLGWIELMSEPRGGRVGYTDRGELSSRNSQNEQFPRDGEAMTAVGLLLRLQLGMRPLTTPMLVEQAKLIAAKPPRIDKQWGGDQYYWYYATWALHEYGVPFWEAWEDELRKVVIPAQLRLGEAEGSWDPIGPWGSAMGRVCATALMALTLECPYRYPRALDAR